MVVSFNEINLGSDEPGYPQFLDALDSLALHLRCFYAPGFDKVSIKINEKIFSKVRLTYPLIAPSLHFPISTTS